jgi:dTDP-4-dehydrorhamnose 3,5-epimerase
MIDGVKTKKLAVHCDERGRLAEMLRSDDEMFIKFGQVYMTTVYPGCVKAWHYHKKQADSFVCVKGMIKLVLFDSRPNSKTKGEVNEFFIGEHNPMLVQIPEDVYHGFKGISETESIIINTPSNTYNPKQPDEYRLDADTKEIPYDWARKDR